MHLIYQDLTIRNATADDAELLCAWWNDGKIMVHVGFPNGLGTTPDEIAKSIAANDDKHRLHIIEHNGKPIGEMNYRTSAGKTAEIGIKICDFTVQEKGLGTTLLTIFIDALFEHYGYEKILIDTCLKNKRAQHVYEKKLGFRFTHTEEDSWTDQLGQLQSSIHYEMLKSDWFRLKREQINYNIEGIDTQ